MITLPALLSALGAASLPFDNVDPAAVMDQDTGRIVMGEIRVGSEDEAFVSAEVARFDADERRESVCTLRAEPDEGDWRVVGFSITGKPVWVEQENSIAFMRGMMDEIRAERVPDLGKLLQEHLGLKLPITGDR